MKLNTYLVFVGRCREAFEFYQSVLGGNIEAMFTHAGTPAEAHTPPEWLDKIMHARLSVDGNLLMGSDAPPDRYKTPHSFSVNIGTDEEISIRDLIALIVELSGAETRVVFDASKPGGQPRRNGDFSKAAALCGFQARTPLREGIAKTLAWYRDACGRAQ